MQPSSYRAAARRLRHYADMLEQYAEAGTPQARAALTQTIHGIAQYGQRLSARHRRSKERGAGK